MRLALVLPWLAFLGLCPAPRAVSAAPAPMPHWDLNMSGEEYRHALRRQYPVPVSWRDGLDAPIAAGERLYQWIAKLNATRPPETALALSTPETQAVAGIPIEDPARLSPKLVKNEEAQLRDELPLPLVGAFFGSSALPSTTLVAEDQFLRWGRRVDRLYQRAARWRLLKQWLGPLAERKKLDVRGYYHLKTDPRAVEDLSIWSTLPPARQQQLAAWLTGLCVNAGFSSAACKQSVTDSANASGVALWYRRYLPHGEKTWKQYFAMPKARTDVQWTSGVNARMTIPFVRPKSAKVEEFVRRNVEEEWRLPGWQLLLQMVSSGPAAYIVFEAGATPHVNELAGNIITMDANQSIDEFNVQWTIRHEFGHVLGLPDCYVEFYDEAEQTMISYQLDTSDLMCSRAGHMNQRLHDELKKAYYR